MTVTFSIWALCVGLYVYSYIPSIYNLYTYLYSLLHDDHDVFCYIELMCLLIFCMHMHVLHLYEYFICYFCFAVYQMLASEIQKDVQGVKSQLQEAKRRKRRRRKGLSGSRPALIRARSIAANILNVSGADLEDILDTDEVGCPGGSAAACLSETQVTV